MLGASLDPGTQCTGQEGVEWGFVQEGYVEAYSDSSVRQMCQEFVHRK